MAAGITFSLDIITASLAFFAGSTPNWIEDVTGIDRFRRVARTLVHRRSRGVRARLFRD